MSAANRIYSGHPRPSNIKNTTKNKAGNSIINQPNRLLIIGPQVVLECRPYGAVTNCKSTKVRTATPIQMYINRLKFSIDIILFYYSVLFKPFKCLFQRNFNWTRRIFKLLFCFFTGDILMRFFQDIKRILSI